MKRNMLDNIADRTIKADQEEERDRLKAVNAELLEALEWAYPNLIMLRQAIQDGIISPSAFANDHVDSIGALIAKTKQ